MQQPQPQRKIIDLPDSLDPYAPSHTAATTAAAAYAKKAVIRPPEIQETIAPETPIRYVIDSRDRHLERYPDPAQYELVLPHEIKNVSSVRLLVADVPFSRYLIHSGNCAVHVTETAPTWDATASAWTLDDSTYRVAYLPYGEYTASTLATALATALGAGYAVTVDTTRESFVITRSTGRVFTLGFAGSRVPYGPQSKEQVSVSRGDGTYTYETRTYGDTSISYRQGTAARVLGFGPGVYHAALTGRLSATGNTAVVGRGTRFTTELSAGDVLTCSVPGSPATTATVTVAAVISDTAFTATAAVTLAAGTLAFTGTLRAPFRYRLAKDRYIVMKLQNVDTNRGIHPTLDQSFALIHSKETELNNEYEEHYIKRFDPALPNLSRLSIAFYDYDGTLYDFQNADHRIELLFTTQSLSRRLG